jgi:hypothetical protein
VSAIKDFIIEMVMAGIFSVQVQIEPPKGTYHGRVVEGRYIIQDGWVVLTTVGGEPVRDDEGKEYKQKLEGARGCPGRC